MAARVNARRAFDRRHSPDLLAAIVGKEPAPAGRCALASQLYAQGEILTIEKMTQNGDFFDADFLTGFLSTQYSALSTQWKKGCGAGIRLIFL